MDMPLKDDNTVTFNATLFAVVRTALNIKTGLYFASILKLLETGCYLRGICFSR